MRHTFSALFQNQGRHSGLIALAGFTLTLYFLIHAVCGDRGVFAERHIRLQINMAEAALARLQKQQADLSQSYAGLEGKHLSRDELEEQAYATLGYAAPQDEIILFRDPAQPPARQ